MFQIEWYYFSVLKQGGASNLTYHIYQELNKNPSLFAQLVSFVWKPDEGEWKDGLTRIGRANFASRGENAHRVLKSWKTLPGMDGDGNCDFTTLREYLEEAILLCSAKNRKNRCFYEIGEMLGRAEVKCDSWPHPKISELIDDFDNEELNKGFYFGYLNKKEGMLRAAGFNKESELAAIKYYYDIAKELSTTYPVTSLIVEDIAASKKRHAEYEELRGSQDDD